MQTMICMAFTCCSYHGGACQLDPATNVGFHAPCCRGDRYVNKKFTIIAPWKCAHVEDALIKAPQQELNPENMLTRTQNHSPHGLSCASLVLTALASAYLRSIGQPFFQKDSHPRIIKAASHIFCYTRGPRIQ